MLLTWTYCCPWQVSSGQHPISVTPCWSCRTWAAPWACRWSWPARGRRRCPPSSPSSPLASWPPGTPACAEPKWTSSYPGGDHAHSYRWFLDCWLIIVLRRTTICHLVFTGSECRTSSIWGQRFQPWASLMPLTRQQLISLEYQVNTHQQCIQTVDFYYSDSSGFHRIHLHKAPVVCALKVPQITNSITYHKLKATQRLL